MKPANDLELVQRLACNEETCIIYAPVFLELSAHGLDSDDLRGIISSELGEKHCFKTKPTEKYYPATQSDYYTIWIDECRCRMFIKLLVATGDDDKNFLVVTSFKKDTNYET